ncbi:MAG: hypothetical protein Q4G69_04775 [Planctomycetia bacterium]|nr:hypothetical protein [Planctomycetia bacterium]
MAINVICPGCMTRFQVDDRFAGKKGPCPKCGHIIEIPKEKLIIHAPEDITSGGKTVPGGSTLRPITQVRFIFNRRQLFLAFLGIIAICAVAFGLGFWENCFAKAITGLVCTFLIGIPLTAYGYMMIREEDDLEILLGNELYKRSFFASLGFALVWTIFEAFVVYLNPGPAFVIYLVPTMILGSIVGIYIYDTNGGKAALLFSLFVLSVLLLRGIMFVPDGWIWEKTLTRVRAVPSASAETGPASTDPAAAAKTPAGKKADPKTAGNQKTNPVNKTPGNVQKKEPAPAAPLTREAPDVRKMRNR